jgi:hypothetical protein
VAADAGAHERPDRVEDHPPVHADPPGDAGDLGALVPGAVRVEEAGRELDVIVEVEQHLAARAQAPHVAREGGRGLVEHEHAAARVRGRLLEAGLDLRLVGGQLVDDDELVRRAEVPPDAAHRVHQAGVAPEGRDDDAHPPLAIARMHRCSPP